jgi:hypothetical protein
LVPVRKQPGLKVPAFSPALLVLIAPTGTNGPYKLGPMAFFSTSKIFFSKATVQFMFYKKYLCSIRNYTAPMIGQKNGYPEA